MADTIQLRGGTAALWTSTNPILANKEVGIETDTRKVKIGNGVTAWNSLSYLVTFISSVAINGSNHLICTMSDGSTVDAGLVSGSSTQSPQIIDCNTYGGFGNTLNRGTGGAFPSSPVSGDYFGLNGIVHNYNGSAWVPVTIDGYLITTAMWTKAPAIVDGTKSWVILQNYEEGSGDNGLGHQVAVHFTNNQAGGTFVPQVTIQHDYNNGGTLVLVQQYEASMRGHNGPDTSVFTGNSFNILSLDSPVVLGRQIDLSGHAGDWVPTGGTALVVSKSYHGMDGWGNDPQFASDGSYKRFTHSELEYSLSRNIPPIAIDDYCPDYHPLGTVWPTGRKVLIVDTVDLGNSIVTPLSVGQISALVGTPWEGHAGHIAVPLDYGWDFIVPVDGQICFYQSSLQTLRFNGTVWQAKTAAQHYHSHQSGLEGEAAITDNGNGTFNVGSIECWFYKDSSRDDSELVVIDTTNNLTPTDEVTGYVCADYQNTNWIILNSLSSVDFLQYIPYFKVIKRTGSNNMHFQKITHEAHGDLERELQRELECNEYQRVTGTFEAISVDASLNISVSGGAVWVGRRRYTIPAVTTASRQFKCINTGASWSISSNTIPVINNTQYNGVAGAVTLTDTFWTINYLFRGIEDQDHVYSVLGTAEFETSDLAKASTYVATLPELVSAHAMLIGRVIVQKGATTGFICESAYNTVFAASASISDHGMLVGLADDDHTQYHNDTRGDARYVQKNTAITAGSGIKLTYDAKGLVTGVGTFANTDLPAMTNTVGGAVPTPPNDNTKVLRGDGTWGTAASGALGGAGLQYTFDTNVGGNPATGTLRIGNNAITTTTLLHISETDAGGLTTDSILDLLVTPGCWIKLYDRNAPDTNYHWYQTTATFTSTGSPLYDPIPVVWKFGKGTFIQGTSIDSVLELLSPVMTNTTAGSVPTPPNNTTSFLRGDGTFAAPVVSNIYGGNATTLLGSIPYQSNTDTTTLLAPNTTTTKKFLRMTGTGANGAVPAWDTLIAADVPPVTNLAGGNNTTLLGSIPYQSNAGVTTLLSPNTSATKQFLNMTGTGANGAAPAWSALVAADIPAVNNIVGGNTTTLLGSIPYQSGVNTTTLLAPNTTATKKFLRMTGTGANGAIPAWDTLVAADVPAVTNIAGGNNTTLLGAMPYQSNTDTTTQLAPNTTATKKFLTQTGTGTNGAAPGWNVIAAADLPAMTNTVGGAVPTPPNNTTTFLRGDGTFAAVTAGVATPAGSNMSVQYNDASATGGDSNFLWDKTLKILSLLTGYLGQTAAAAPTPVASTLLSYIKDYAGKLLPTYMGPSGVDWSAQSHALFSNVRYVIATGSTASYVGTATLTSTGGSAIAYAAGTTGSIYNTMHKITLSCGTTAGTVTYFRPAAGDMQCYLGNAAGQGGFFFGTRFMLSAMQTGQRIFVGLHPRGTAPTNVDPNTEFNTVGLTCIANSGNWAISMNNGSGTATVTTLSSPAIPVNTTSVIELILFAAPNSANINYRVTDLTTGNVATGTLTTKTPAVNTVIAPMIWFTNNATAAAVTVYVNKIYLETDY